MKSSINEFLKIDELKNNLLTIAESKFEIKKLELVGKLEALLSKLILYFLIAIFVFVIFILLHLIIAVFINHFTQTYWIGYASLLAFYLILYLVFHFNKPKVIAMISKIVTNFVEKQSL